MGLEELGDQIDHLGARHPPDASPLIVRGGRAGALLCFVLLEGITRFDWDMARFGSSALCRRGPRRALLECAADEQ